MFLLLVEASSMNVCYCVHVFVENMHVVECCVDVYTTFCGRDRIETIQPATTTGLPIVCDFSRLFIDLNINIETFALAVTQWKLESMSERRTHACVC